MNKKITLTEALIPIIFLVVLLAYNVQEIYGDEALSGSNQFALLLGASVAALIGFKNKIGFEEMMEAVSKNIKSTSGAILILLFVGGLSGTWLLSGVIPTMIYYGLQILNAKIFLVASVIIAALISLATGSSWSTSATVGIALIGIGKALGIDEGMIAGAVISGAYFGDKISPLSDTTNLASAVAGVDLFTHIRYMLKTTIPSISIALILFVILGFTQDTGGDTVNVNEMLDSIEDSFTISPWLMIVPGVVIFLIIKKTEPLIALMIGTLLGGVFAIIFQPHIIEEFAKVDNIDFNSAYKVVMNAITKDTAIESTNSRLNDLFTSGGMAGMLGTIWLIITAMVFGGIMEAIGALNAISNALLKVAKGDFGVFASTVTTCIFFNGTVSDQYLAIVVPGKMYKTAFDDKGLAPENLSRTLEDSGTVTSVLFPWNTGGAYNSRVLTVDTFAYLPYAFFNLLSPLMTLIFAYFKIKIKKVKSKTEK